MRFLFKRMVFIGVILSLSSCFKTVNPVGYTFDKRSLDTIEIGKTRKAIVQRRLGSPSVKSSFGDDVWYYIAIEHESFAFFDPKVVSQNIVAIEFSEKDEVKRITNYTVDDARRISISGDVTQTQGHDLSVIQQLLGNVGRFDSDGKAKTPAP